MVSLGTDLNPSPFFPLFINPSPSEPLLPNYYLGPQGDISLQFVDLFVFNGYTAFCPVVCFVYPVFLISHPADTVDTDIASQAGRLGRQTFFSCMPG